MRKNMKTLGALACAGVLGLGAIGNTAMAAAPTGDTNVFYVSNSASIDQDGKVVMVIPADVTLTKDKLQGDMTLSMMTVDNTQKLPKNFTAKVSIDSENEGLLKSATSSVTGEYDLLNEQGTDLGVDLSQQGNFADFHTFTDNTGTQQKLDYKFKASVESGESKKLEETKQGTTFSDKLTFKVSQISGDGITGIQ